tara:strand:+ start:3608 stop:3799 length:192 start_codon:yes stop_codon:yes gene_type:complete
MKLSHQAMGAIMMALQNSILEQSDIVPVLEDFDFDITDNQDLVVVNPPQAKTLQEIEDKFSDA